MPNFLTRSMERMDISDLVFKRHDKMLGYKQ